MDAKYRKHLETVVDAIISEDTDKADFAFHEYLRTKTQDVLAESGEYEEDSSDDGSEDEEKSKKTKKAKMPSEGACGGKR